MKQIKNFFSSKWMLIIPLLAIRIIVLLEEYYGCSLFETIGIPLEMPYSFFPVYFFLGLSVSKIKKEKKMFRDAAIFEISLSFIRFATTSWNFLHPMCFHLGFLNPLNYLVYLNYGQSLSVFIICTLLSPASVGFVYLFSKTPLLFKFLKRIRIKKSGKSITFYLKETEAEK